MTTLLALLAGAMVTGGVVWLIASWQGSPAPARRRIQRFHFDRMARQIVVGVAAGLVIALLTGWLITLVLTPVLVVLGPGLLWPKGGQRRTARLEGLEEFARSLASVLSTGIGLEQAIIVAGKSAPEPINAEIRQLVRRLRAGVDTASALRAFADEIDDPVGDLLVGNLLLAANLRGPGVAAALENLADSIAAETTIRRQIRAEQAKAISDVRSISAITVVGIVAIGFSGTYIEPYRTPLGQVLIAVLLGVYTLLLWWMSRLVADPRLPRFMGSKASRVVPGSPEAARSRGRG